MATLIELAERCEAADGEDRLLDVDIWMALGLAPAGAEHEGCPGWVKAPRIAFGCDKSPSYTASLDAAMTLVPDVLRWCVDTCAGRPHAFCEDLNDFSDDATCHRGNAATPALALCAAALRARAAQGIDAATAGETPAAA